MGLANPTDALIGCRMLVLLGNQLPKHLDRNFDPILV